MSEIVDEPEGGHCSPGFVKFMPENNSAYLEFYKDWEYYPVIKDADEAMEKKFPGYNISQIKVKFGGIRFYATQGNCPDEVWDAREADQVIHEALKGADL